MPICNRDVDVSQQKEVWSWASNNATGASYGLGVGTGLTLAVMGPMPYPYTLQSVQGVAVGASGAPQLVFSIFRPGNGNTVIAVSISNMIIVNGASNAVTSYSGLAAAGSTLLQGQRGDVLLATTAVSNTACSQLLLNMIVKKTQDIVSHNGVSS